MTLIWSDLANTVLFCSLFCVVHMFMMMKPIALPQSNPQCYFLPRRLLLTMEVTSHRGGYFLPRRLLLTIYGIKIFGGAPQEYIESIVERWKFLTVKTATENNFCSMNCRCPNFIKICYYPHLPAIVVQSPGECAQSPISHLRRNIYTIRWYQAGSTVVPPCFSCSMLMIFSVSFKLFTKAQPTVFMK